MNESGQYKKEDTVSKNNNIYISIKLQHVVPKKKKGTKESFTFTASVFSSNCFHSRDAPWILSATSNPPSTCGPCVCDLQGRKINFANLKTLVLVVTDRGARCLKNNNNEKKRKQKKKRKMKKKNAGKKKNREK